MESHSSLKPFEQSIATGTQESRIYMDWPQEYVVTPTQLCATLHDLSLLATGFVDFPLFDIPNQTTLSSSMTELSKVNTTTREQIQPYDRGFGPTRQGVIERYHNHTNYDPKITTTTTTTTTSGTSRRRKRVATKQVATEQESETPGLSAYDKRRAQNRAAQQAFRERTKQRIKSLEEELAQKERDYESLQVKYSRLSSLHEHVWGSL
ncbi:hypothetical protein BGZ63DRAFT_388141, partial [Mariannaea sp. PMI_226]